MKTAPSALTAVALAAGFVLVAGVARAAAPVTGSIAGPVTAVQGQTFTLRSSLSPTGKSKVHVGSTTSITEQQSASRTELKKGLCAFAGGQKNTSGIVQATQLTLFAQVKGKCQATFGGRRRSGKPPSGGQQPPRRNSGSVGFAAGEIVAVSGSTVTLRSQQGTTKVAVSSKTQIARLVRVTMSAIKVGVCTFVEGASSDKGVNVTAQTVSVFKPGANGCTMGPRRK